MSSNTILVALLSFTADGVTYKVGDEIPADHAAAWIPGTLGRRLNNGFCQYQLAHEHRAPAEQGEDPTMGGMKPDPAAPPPPPAPGPEDEEDTPDDEARQQRFAELKAMPADQLKALAEAAGLTYTNKNVAAASLTAKEFTGRVPVLVPPGGQAPPPPQE